MRRLPLLVFVLVAGVALAARQQPSFRASTDIVVIDAQVVAKDSTPIAGLKADGSATSFRRIPPARRN